MKKEILTSKNEFLKKLKKKMTIREKIISPIN